MEESDSPVVGNHCGDQNALMSAPTSNTEPKCYSSRMIVALHLFVLWSFAVAQPAFGLLSTSTRLRFLNDAGIEPRTLVLLTVVISLLSPALLIALEALTGRVSPKARGWLHIALVAVLSGAVFLQAIGRIPGLSGLIVVPCGILGGVAFARAYHSWRWWRAIVTASSPGIVVFPVWFLIFSPVSNWIMPEPARVAGTASVGRPTPIVMIVLDEACGLSLMNEDREIDPTLFPNFSNLAQRGTWYRNATTVHPFTSGALPAILTGQYPRKIRMPTLEHNPDNLFTLLLASDQYEFVVFEPYTRLFPNNQDTDVRKTVGLGQQLLTLQHDLLLAYANDLKPSDFPLAIPDPSRAWSGVLGSDVSPEKSSGVFRYYTDLNRDEQFEHFLRCLQPREKPALYFMHLLLPHSPWNFLPSGRKYKEEKAKNGGPAGAQEILGMFWGPDEFVVAQNEQRYYLQFRYVDHLLGRLIGRLKEEGLFDSALIMVMADHGTCFVANRERRVPNEDTFGDILSIPMLVKAPGQQSGGPDDRNVESVDVLPTILATLDYRPLPETDGQNVLDPKALPRPEKLFFQGQLNVLDPKALPRPEKLFSQKSQPHTLAADFPEGWEALKRMLLRRNASLDSLFGPAQELVGRDVGTLSVGPKSNLRSGWAYAADEVQDDPKALLPCLFQGRVTPAPEPEQPVTLAIAVNGIIAGVTRTYQLKKIPDQWSLLFAEKYLRTGKNSFDLYEVRGAAGRRTLHQMTTTSLSRVILN
jgi:hypothetical protein